EAHLAGDCPRQDLRERGGLALGIINEFGGFAVGCGGLVMNAANGGGSVECLGDGHGLSLTGPSPASLRSAPSPRRRGEGSAAAPPGTAGTRLRGGGRGEGEGHETAVGASRREQ